MSFKSDVVEANGNVSFERVLEEIAYRFVHNAEFNLSPKRAGQIIAQVLVELEEARGIAKAIAPQPSDREEPNRE